MRTFGLLAVIAIISFSCGSASSQLQRQNFSNQKEFNYSGGNYQPSEYYVDGEYFCTVDQNFEPDVDEFLDGRRFYQACTSTTTSSAIRITGEPGNGSQLCFFPAIDNSGTITVFGDPQTGGVVHSCGSINRDQQVVFDFPGYEYNAGFIVDVQYELNMELCLFTNEAGLCPVFSYGNLFYPAD